MVVISLAALNEKKTTTARVLAQVSQGLRMEQRRRVRGDSLVRTPVYVQRARFVRNRVL